MSKRIYIYIYENSQHLEICQIYVNGKCPYPRPKMNGKCHTPRAQKSGKSPTLSRGGGTLGDSLDTSIIVVGITACAKQNQLNLQMRQYLTKNNTFNTVFLFVFNYQVSYYKITHYQNSCKILTKYPSSRLYLHTRVPLRSRFILNRFDHLTANAQP